MFEGVCEKQTVAGVQAADPFALAAALARVSEDQLSGCTLDEAECVVAATQRAINALSARQSVAVTRYSDLDHVIAYPAGPTTAANLQSLCRTHHGFKHHGGWTVRMTPDCTWTAPNGRSHTTHPHNLHDDAA